MSSMSSMSRLIPLINSMSGDNAIYTQAAVTTALTLGGLFAAGGLDKGAVLAAVATNGLGTFIANQWANKMPVDLSNNHMVVAGFNDPRAVAVRLTLIAVTLGAAKKMSGKDFNMLKHGAIMVATTFVHMGLAKHMYVERVAAPADGTVQVRNEADVLSKLVREEPVVSFDGAASADNEAPYVHGVVKNFLKAIGEANTAGKAEFVLVERGSESLTEQLSAQPPKTLLTLAQDLKADLIANLPAGNTRDIPFNVLVGDDFTQEQYNAVPAAVMGLFIDSNSNLTVPAAQPDQPAQPAQPPQPVQ